MTTNYESSLKTYLAKYKYPDAAKREVTNILGQYRDLRPSHDNFVFNDGTQKQLLNLEGTIPVPYKGNVYNIPMCIWIMDTHPYNPPMAYVRPTSSMQIKPNRYVDANGKVDLPYLREWKYTGSDLLSLIQILIFSFGEECPVFSRHAPSQPPPYPMGQGGGGGPPMGGQPPYPTGQVNMPMPGAAHGGSNPPYPPYSGGQPGYPSTGYPPYPAPGGGGYPPQGGQNYGGFQGYPSQGQGYTGGSQGQYPPYSYGSGSNPPYPPSTAAYPATSAATTTSTAVGRPGTGTVTEAHIRASLLSAVEDKMRRRLRETFAQAQAEMEVLKKTQSDLMSGKDRLERMVRDLETEKEEIDRNIQLLNQKDVEVKDALRKLESNDQLEIDDAVVTTTPLYRQLLNAFAEEQAIEDTVYYLGEALRKNVVDLEVFLKQVRELSRKQFLLRALIQKCREKAGLPPLA
ncbi:tumor susceptibility gene 101 protein-like [Haliotis rufescens]|uniref:tumor susceptibility gene 101 protein-like n=1 Tax=Haliotis rufescens TaxID=6454 RepID=UPI001EAFD49B|nr:tumor susceptibility gene 101 protein-like [Haliotis rufescens]